jgi:hypothetical protein
MNDKMVVQLAQDSFDVVVLQANLAVSMSRGLSSWNELRKPFWIDPIAYAYAASTAYLKSRQKVEPGSKETELRFKRTFVRLAEAYGEPFTRVVEQDRPLRPDDFDPAYDDDVVRRLLEWQRDALTPPQADLKYFDEAAMQPVLLAVPYFPLQPFPSSVSEPRWLEINLRFVEAALRSNVVPAERLAVAVLVEDGLMDLADVFDPIWQRYLELPVEHLWLWVSDNDEVAEMTAARARHLRTLVVEAAERGKRVHQAFGGSFSTFLLADGLASVAHGAGYWEHKNWEPLAPGGMPTLRFFYPPLRRRLTFLEADASIPDVVTTEADFFAHICDCQTCRETLAGGLDQFRLYGEVERRSRVDRFGNSIAYDVPVPRAMSLSKLHYLRSKADEVALATGPAFDPAAVLQVAIDEYEGRLVPVRPLRNWLTAFTAEA